MNDLEEFHHQLIADVQGDADVFGLMAVEAFFEKTGEILTEAGEIDGASRAYFEGNYSRGSLQIDGYGGDPRDDDGILSLILCDFALGDEVRVLHKEHVQRLLQRIHRFLIASRKSDFRDQLEETSAGFGVADLISTTWRKIEKIKLIIVTNGDFRARADAARMKDVDGKSVTLSVWDLKRLKQFMEQGQVRANLVIDFAGDFGGGIPILAASGGGTALESYLAVIPGIQLAEIYEKWGPRLLEANVRSFLQARSKVNRGIRDTIRQEPRMFFPYNNGLSATADAIDLDQTENGLRLVKADNLQIVNGGQTTASLHAARKDSSEELAQVHVQMKLTIVPQRQSESVVPRISEFANSQNRVNAADFFANHPFHIRIEELSRRILAPSGRDGYRETKWFYERARGQYADERGRRTPAERKKFDAEFPRSQFLTKTDLAKYENTWACEPHTVSLGAQKNFTDFAGQIGKRWGKKGNTFNDLWFKRMIAKAITFRATEKIVSAAIWYEGGYRANIVTYAIAKIVHDAAMRDLLVDLDTIWRQQEIPPALKKALQVAGAEAQAKITNPDQGIRNNSEWAKKQACWNQLSEHPLTYPDDFEDILVATDDVDNGEDDNGIEAELVVYNLGAAFWASVHSWARGHGLLTPRESGILKVCTAMPAKLPSGKQCEIAMSVLEKILKQGFSAPELEEVKRSMLNHSQE